jgi:hypothetical protein
VVQWSQLSSEGHLELCCRESIGCRLTKFGGRHQTSPPHTSSFSALLAHQDSVKSLFRYHPRATRPPKVHEGALQSFSASRNLHSHIMPPKGKGEQPKVKKVAVDKTFGMKNKKGGAAQKHIKQIQATAASGGTPDEKRKAAEKLQKEKEKKAAEDAKKEMADLFKPVQVQKVPFGVDPKTILCQFFKKGNCEKGRKCKFSHDLNVERKTEKRSLYTDSREGQKEAEEEAKKKDNMDDWDEEKLRNVVLSKHGNPKTTTDKVCKFFIQAIEDQKYGWFWTCPNGGDKCMYKHSLPPGYVPVRLECTEF